MLKSDICRALSEALEPMPAPLAYRDLRLVSPLGFWEWSQTGDGWQPVNYFTSEDASARLLEAMPEALLQRGMFHGNNQTVWFCTASEVVVREAYECDEETYPDGYAHHADRKTAIALAACKWLQIDVDTIEEG